MKSVMNFAKRMITPTQRHISLIHFVWRQMLGKGWEMNNTSYHGFFEALDIGEQREVLDATPAPEQLEDGGQLIIDELVEINLGTEDGPRPTFVSASLTPEERENYREFLMEFRDCFAWSYKEMPRVDHQVATHKLSIDPMFRLVKQQPRHLSPKLQDDIIAEVEKLIIAGFIKEAQYPWWLASIVPVAKKNGQV
jgi:hypothetical protein